MNTLMPSLEHRALIKMTITLWNPDDIHLDDIEWKNGKWIAEDHVIGKGKRLPLPESLKKKILGFIKPIGFEIFKWINHYQNVISDCDRIDYFMESLDDVERVGKSLSKLCWTPQGTVDRKKTAEELIRDDNLDIIVRYRLACIYCLRNDVLKLWNKMPENCRESFYSEDPEDVDQNDLVKFWTYDIKGELTRMDNLFKNSRPMILGTYEWAFFCAVDIYNKVATEYFLQTLTSEEKEGCLEIAVQNCVNEDPFPVQYADVFVFLFSLLNEQQQLNFKWNIYDMLPCLLHWPWQDMFTETVNRFWPFLPENSFLNLLNILIDKVIEGFMDYDYKKIFREFWQQSPITHKNYVKNKCAHFLNKLFQIGDIEYFRIIFASIQDREKLLFSDDGQSVCESLIFNDKLDLLEVFVQECISSKDVIIKLKEEFENHIMHRCLRKKTLAEKKDELSKFFQLLDELILDDNKKRVDERNTDLDKSFSSVTNE